VISLGIILSHLSPQVECHEWLCKLAPRNLKTYRLRRHVHIITSLDIQWEKSRDEWLSGFQESHDQNVFSTRDDSFILFSMCNPLPIFASYIIPDVPMIFHFVDVDEFMETFSFTSELKAIYPLWYWQIQCFRKYGRLAS
jgi:hypothetical protein